MFLMILDHARDYFHYQAFNGNPEDLQNGSAILFFTRFITHYCAPIFILLAGTAAYLYGHEKKKADLSRFLATRGVFLIILEIAVMNLLWWFDPGYHFINLQVIWCIGICFLLMSVLIWMPQSILILLSVAIILGHNALNNATLTPNEWQHAWWYILHQGGYKMIGSERLIAFTYPIIPWIGVMGLGYVMGAYYKVERLAKRRRADFKWIGVVCILTFILIRFLHIYGDPIPWKAEYASSQNVLAFLRLTKYPPSLDFLLITLGPAFLFLSIFDKVQMRSSHLWRVFGRVPLFLYVVHVFMLHAIATIALLLIKGSAPEMIITFERLSQNIFQDYGYPLWVVYLVWIFTVITLYPLCKWYGDYKKRNKDKVWTSYL